MSNRKGILFGFTTVAGFLALASVASACVTFMGNMEVKGHDGITKVAGAGKPMTYCSTGQPTTAAAGHLDDPIRVEVKPTVCADAGAAGANQLPDGTYEVRYMNRRSYTFDGTYWRADAGTGCFHSRDAAWTSTLGSFTVTNGTGEWDGDIGLNDIAGLLPVFSLDNEANLLCIGAPTVPPVNGIPGMHAPYRLLAI